MVDFASTEVETSRLCLEPLSLDHVREMVTVLGDHRIYAFTGGEPQPWLISNGVTPHRSPTAKGQRQKLLAEGVTTAVVS
jgi:hypothetical protein